MSPYKTSPTRNQDRSLSRREFIAGTHSAAAANASGGRAAESRRHARSNWAWSAAAAAEHGSPALQAARRLRDACRGRLLPGGGRAAGDALGVDKSRRSPASRATSRLIESGVEAVALETPPYFFPEHAQAAVDAGLHVYMAKPVAVDVPGCLTIEAAGKAGHRREAVFLVDYQMPTDPHNIECAQRIRALGDPGPGQAAFTTAGCSATRP